jgi:hypothetical protein
MSLDNSNDGQLCIARLVLNESFLVARLTAT